MMMEALKFSTIYADPAWTYTLWGKSSGRSASDKYTTMTIDDMMQLPVANVASDNSVLLMWATYPNLIEALELGKAWGFTYKTCAFTWFKKTENGKNFMGMGYWTRANAEPCLLFTRGNPKRRNADVRQMIDDRFEQAPLFDDVYAQIQGHSTKPLCIYDRIERLCEPSYLELFSRTRRNGWTSLGYDIDGQDLRDSIPALVGG